MVYNLTDTDKQETSDFNKKLEGQVHERIIELCLIDIAESLRVIKFKIGRKLF